LGFPTVFLVLWICPTLYRILEPILKRPMFPLYFMLTVSRYSHGLWNTIILILSDRVGHFCDNLRKTSKGLVFSEQDLYDTPSDISMGDFEKWVDMDESEMVTAREEE